MKRFPSVGHKQSLSCGGMGGQKHLAGGPPKQSSFTLCLLWCKGPNKDSPLISGHLSLACGFSIPVEEVIKDSFGK